MSTLSIVLWSLLGLYLAGAIIFVALNRRYIGGGWFQTMVSALAWPAVLVVLLREWRRD